MAQLRADRGLTLDALGALAKVSQATAHRAESEPPDSLRSLTVEQLLVGLHTVKPLSEDDVEVLCRLAGLSSGIVHSIRRRLQEVDERRGQARAIPEQDDEMYRQACYASVDHLTRLISARSAWMILQKLIAEKMQAPVGGDGKEHKFTVPPGAVAYPVTAEPGLLVTMVEPTSVPVKRARREEKAG
jgi:hypothetical protein